jgi:hypothetical protein
MCTAVRTSNLIKKVWLCGDIQRHNARTECNQNSSRDSQVETDPTTPISRTSHEESCVEQQPIGQEMPSCYGPESSLRAHADQPQGHILSQTSPLLTFLSYFLKLLAMTKILWPRTETDKVITFLFIVQEWNEVWKCTRGRDELAASKIEHAVSSIRTISKRCQVKRACVMFAQFC